MNGTARLFGMILGLALGLSANAAEVVATLTANGEIRIGPDGHVISHKIEEKVPASVADAISRNVATWTFEPVLEQGRPVIAVARMHLLVEAVEHSADEVALRLGGVWFGEEIIPIDSGAPVYPDSAVRHRVGAVVTMALRLDEEGRVVEAHAYQTSFPKQVDKRLAVRLRPDFERASVRAAREWRYDATRSKPGGTTILAPINYTISVQGEGQSAWMMLVPGDIVPPPWPMDDAAGGLVQARPHDAAILTDTRIRPTRALAGTPR